MGRAKIKKLPSQTELKRLFNYDQGTGSITWRISPRAGMMAGAEAGTVGRSKYLTIGIDRRYYLAHRLIWKWMTGDDPSEFVDHIDGDKLNNRWVNLRGADNGQNKRNCPIYSNNMSGVKGVCWDASHKKWRAYISVGGVQLRLGRFKSIDEAALVVSEAREELHGEFARSI